MNKKSPVTTDRGNNELIYGERVTQQYKDMENFKIKPQKLPAVYFDMPNEDYHRGEWQKDFVSSTMLKNYLISPKYFNWCRSNPTSISLEASMKGSVYHSILASITNTGCLDDFYNEFFIFDPPINPKTGCSYGISSNKYMDIYNQACADNKGKESTSKAEVDLAMKMVEELLNHCGSTTESVEQLLEWGTAEVSHFVMYNGIGAKFRTDLRTEKKIVDWKTISAHDLHEDTITRQIIKMNYGFSAAFYQFFDYQMTGKWSEFYWVFQQKEPPYDAVLVSAEFWAYSQMKGLEDQVHKGPSAIEFENVLEQHLKCTDMGYYPGAEVFLSPNYKGRRIMELSVPAYKRNNINFFYN